MNRVGFFWVSLPVLLLAAICSGMVNGQGSSPAPALPLSARWVDGPPAAEAKLLRRELTAKQRRDLGLSLAAVRDAVRELKRSGAIDDRSSTSEIAAKVLESLEAKDPKAFAAPGLDLDAILEWLETIVPLIMKIIALFSASPA